MIYIPTGQPCTLMTDPDEDGYLVIEIQGIKGLKWITVHSDDVKE